MSELVIYKDETGKLQGLGEKGRRAYEKFRKKVAELEVGETLKFSYKLPRSPRHHKFFFWRLNELFSRQESFKDEDELLVFLKVGAGFVDFLPGPDGGLVAVPKSIAWENLEEHDFTEVKRKMWDFLWTLPARKALWPHMRDDQSNSMIAAWIKEVE